MSCLSTWAGKVQVLRGRPAGRPSRATGAEGPSISGGLMVPVVCRGKLYVERTRPLHRAVGGLGGQPARARKERSVVLWQRRSCVGRRSRLPCRSSDLSCAELRTEMMAAASRDDHTRSVPGSAARAAGKVHEPGRQTRVPGPWKHSTGYHSESLRDSVGATRRCGLTAPSRRRPLLHCARQATLRPGHGRRRGDFRDGCDPGGDLDQRRLDVFVQPVQRARAGSSRRPLGSVAWLIR